MANSLDELPLNDPLVNADGKLSDVWRDALSYLYQNLVGYLNQYGLMLPEVTTLQTNSIQNPTPGVINFNTTTGEPQIYLTGGWKNISHS